MADAGQVAEEFLEAWTHQEFDRARALLRDDVSFVGPFETAGAAPVWSTPVAATAEFQRPPRSVRHA